MYATRVIGELSAPHGHNGSNRWSNSNNNRNSNNNKRSRSYSRRKCSHGW
jgi:hypothetical protein